jgi:hypothetical protein
LKQRGADAVSLFHVVLIRHVQISSLLAGFATAQFTAALKAATFDAEKEPKASALSVSCFCIR